MNARARGFTLLEMLVTLVISSLAVLMLFQTLAGFSHTRERLAAREAVRNNNAVVLGWIGDSFRGVVAIKAPGMTLQADDPAGGLHGDADGFTALTLAPLLGPTGTPTKVTWRIARDPDNVHLTYQEDGQEPLSLPLRDADNLRFAYLDHDGKAQDSWPPKLGEQIALPSAIELQYGHGAQAHTVTQAIAAPLPMQLTTYGREAEE